MIVESRFSLRDPKRPDKGNGRNYNIQNVAEIIENNQWQVEKKLMLGFYGHGSSFLCRESIQNQPSNVCTALRLNGDIVEHTQQILETDTGKIVSALHKAGAGGWSWRAQGTDGGREAETELTALGGFDYVHSPSFLQITESTNGIQKIRHHLIAEGLSNDFADGFLDGINDNVTKEITRLQEDKMRITEEVQMLKEALARTAEVASDSKQSSVQMIKESLMNRPIVLKDDVIDILSRGVRDSTELQTIVETLTGYKSVNFDSLPLDDKPRLKTLVTETFGAEPEFDFDSMFNNQRRF